jgi:hypothetical protein
MSDKKLSRSDAPKAAIFPQPAIEDYRVSLICLTASVVNVESFSLSDKRKPCSLLQLRTGNCCQLSAGVDSGSLSSAEIAFQAARPSA